MLQGRADDPVRQVEPRWLIAVHVRLEGFTLTVVPPTPSRVRGRDVVLATTSGHQTGATPLWEARDAQMVEIPVDPSI
jgi:hypothetical protein